MMTCSSAESPTKQRKTPFTMSKPGAIDTSTFLSGLGY